LPLLSLSNLLTHVHASCTHSASSILHSLCLFHLEHTCLLNTSLLTACRRLPISCRRGWTVVARKKLRRRTQPRRSRYQRHR
jgi:hypothetical protein